MNFRQSLYDFPCPVSLGNKTPSFGLHRYRQGLNFLPIDDEGFTLRGDRRRLLYKGRRRSHRFSILGDTAFEYDCILHKEPDTNVITLLIDGAENYDFFRQPNFVKNPFLKGSYAVYKKVTLLGEGTGKLCHIHRPLIIDALGRRVWGELAVVGNVLRITIPEQWLSMAKYPVIVDPTIGTSTIGSQITGVDPDNDDFDRPCLDNQYAVNKYLVPQNGSGTCTAYVYCYDLHIIDDVLPILYTHHNNRPYMHISQNEQKVNAIVNTSKPAGWRNTTFNINGTINAGDYVWFGYYSSWFFTRFDYGGDCYKGWFNYDLYPDYEGEPSPYITVNDYTTYSTIKWSWYFTYTAVVSQSYSRTLTQSVKMTDSPKLKAEYTKNCSQSVNGSAAAGGYATFFRQCMSNVTNSVIVDKTVGFVRALLENIDLDSILIKGSELLSTIVDTVQAWDFFQQVQGLWRGISETAAAGDTMLYPVLFVRSVNDTAMGTDFFGKLGSFIRGLADTAENTEETYHKGEFYRKETEAVRVEGIAIKGLLLFIRIITQVFMRDYLVRRFLVAREELKLKSCITRDFKLDSKIN